jgi:hypothetical protein
VLPRKAAAGAEGGSLEPGHAPPFPGPGGPSACRKALAASPGSLDYPGKNEERRRSRVESPPSLALCG